MSDEKVEVKREFKDNIKEWLSLDDKTKELKEKIKTLEDRKKVLSATIMNTMKENDIDNLSLNSGGKLKAYTSKTVAPLKKENIYNSLKSELGDDIKAEYLTSKIMDKTTRDVKETTTLKRYK